MNDSASTPADAHRSMKVLWTTFFFQGMALGCWFPSLTNTFGAMGLTSWVPMAFIIPPFCSLIGPLITGAMADQRYAAERIFRWFSLASAVLLALAFASLDLGLHPLWFMVLIGLHALVSGPTWSLLATISLSSLRDPERKFPLARVGATIGWIAGGLLTSYLLHADSTTMSGYTGAVIRLAAAFFGFLLPHTPPLGVIRDWRSRLGFDAFRLFRQRDHLVFFLVTGLFSIPISAYYMYGPEFLKVLGDSRPTGTMTVGQLSEIICLIGLGGILARHSVKTVLMWALGLSILRFAMSAQAGIHDQIVWHIGGLALHGVCYTLYFVTSQIFLDRRVDPGMRSQAQGLLTVMAGGVGPLLGSWICGMMRSALVNELGDGWVAFWFILSGMIAFCAVIFGLFYRGVGKPSRDVSA